MPMAVRSILNIVGELEMNWELEWKDSHKIQKFLKIKSGATYALGMCIVLGADCMSLCIGKHKVSTISFIDHRVYGTNDSWQNTGQILYRRYEEMTNVS